MASKAVEVKLEPVDNQRLARLCGALDENLRQIESALDVTIARRGGKFTVRGEHAQRAAQALEHFYDRASGDLTVEDVQLGLTELSSNTSSGKAEGPQLLTRRPDLHGRTPHQVQYLESILAHDCTIGIGPAGTGKTYLAAAGAVAAGAPSAGARGRSRRASAWASFRAIWRRRSIRTSGPSTTRSTISWASRRPASSSSAARSSSRRLPTCAGARSTTPSSSSTRRRTPRPSR